MPAGALPAGTAEAGHNAPRDASEALERLEEAGHNPHLWRNPKEV